MSRTILHSDMNCFYASVEMLHHPELAGKPMAVGGDPEARHGIVLTANYIAKRAGVKTGMALWQARQVCPEIIFVPPRMDLYLRFSRMAQEIYSEYTDQREPFGIDESWLDVTASTSIKGDGMKIAKEISSRIKYELGVTVTLEGDIQGVMLQVLQKDFANLLINTFYEKELNQFDDISDMDLSVIREMGNITTAAYINSIAKMTNTYINITPPADHVDTIANILSIPAGQFDALGKKVLYIDERFSIADTTIKSSMILILELASMHTLFEKLGIPC